MVFVVILSTVMMVPLFSEGAPILLSVAAIALVGILGLSVTFWRDERGHDSVFRKVPSLPFEDVFDK